MNATSGSPSIREEAPQLGEQARGYCRHLAESIGLRPAGSLAERAALDWLAHQARSLGFQVQWQEFEFAPQPAYLPYYTLAAAGFWLAAALLPVFPYSSLLLPLLIAALPDLADRLHAWLPKRARSANLLVLPNIDAANISYNLLKTAAGGNIAIGPVLLGANKPMHILTPTATVRRIVNMTALTVADANAAR